MSRLKVTDPSTVSLANPNVQVVVPNRWVKDEIRLYKSYLNRDGHPVWTVLQLADIWRVSRRKVLAALAGEPVEYGVWMVPIGINHREERRVKQSTPSVRVQGRVKTRQLVVRGDVADRIYRDKIQPTLKTR